MNTTWIWKVRASLPFPSTIIVPFALFSISGVIGGLEWMKGRGVPDIISMRLDLVRGSPLAETDGRSGVDVRGSHPEALSDNGLSFYWTSFSMRSQFSGE